MNYNKKEIKQGIKMHLVQTTNFKTNLFAVCMAIPIKRETVTLNALLTAVLRRGTMHLKSQDLISKKLEEMYGASFDCGIEKLGDNHIIKLYVETINEEFLPSKEELTKHCLEILFDIAFNPLVINGGFKEEYVQTEKEVLEQIIDSKIDNKAQYAIDRCIEEMYENQPYGVYRFGYIEDLDKITSKSLYEYYKQAISECKIDIFCSGNIDFSEVEEIIVNSKQIKALNERIPQFIQNSIKPEKIGFNDIKDIREKMDISQGKLVIGASIDINTENEKYTTSVFNAILGVGANSKMFQNVREKESLAYTAGSSFVRQKNIILIRAGIEIENYKKALDTINIQLEDIKKGDFTDEEMQNAKNIITESVKSITEEQDSEITYIYGQELAENFVSLEQYVEVIEKQTRDDIIKIAKKIEINVIYFLRD